MCPVDVSQHYTCCGWPWLAPELRELVLRVLFAAPRQELPTSRVLGELRRENRRAQGHVRNPKGCVRDCLTLSLPGPNSMMAVLKELHLRGDIVLDSSSREPVARLMDGAWDGVHWP